MPQVGPPKPSPTISDISSSCTRPESDPRQTALVLIKFADALGRTGRKDVASGQYQLAAQIRARLGAERHRGPGRRASKGRNAVADLDSPVMQAATGPTASY